MKPKTEKKLNKLAYISLIAYFCAILIIREDFLREKSMLYIISIMFGIVSVMFAGRICAKMGV